MQTIHLTEDHVSSYLRGFGKRLRELGAKIPQVWVMVGASGSIIAKRFAKVAPDLLKSSSVLFVAYDRASDLVTFPLEKNPKAVIQGKRVLIIDGTVHSGGTLLRVARELERLGPSALTSYALVVQRGAKIIPNHFGFLIGDHDRVQFPSADLANNRLCEYGVYRKISEEDSTREMIKTGADFMDKISWEDRLFEIATDNGWHVYLYERCGVVCGFISFQFPQKKTIRIEEVGVDVSYSGQGIGGHLMRWAEHCARHRNCTTAELWAVENKVEWYKHLGYGPTEKAPLRLAGRKFWLMRRKLLFNHANDDTLTMGS